MPFIIALSWKVGSSTWDNHLLSIRGIPEMAKAKGEALVNLQSKIGDVFGCTKLGCIRDLVRQNLYHLPEGVKVSNARKALVTFAFVRHPFERLVSMCSDKFRRKTPKECVKVVIATIKGEHWLYKPTDGNIGGQCYQCPFCSMDFDLIGKMDQMDQHTDFLAKMLGIEVGADYSIVCFVSVNTAIIVVTVVLSNNCL